MKTGERYYFVAPETSKFSKGDVIIRKATDRLESLTDKSNVNLYGTDFVPYDTAVDVSKVTLLEVFADVQSNTFEEVETVLIYTVIETGLLYPNAIEIVEDKINEYKLECLLA